MRCIQNLEEIPEYGTSGIMLKSIKVIMENAELADLIEEQVKVRTEALTGELQRLEAELSEHKRIEAAFHDDQKALQQVNIENQRLIHELLVAREEAEQAVAHTRQINRDFRSLNNRLEGILNSLNSAVIGYNDQGVVELANSFAIAMLGFDPLRMPHTTLMRRIKIFKPDGKQFSQKDLAYKSAEKGETVLNVPLLMENVRGRTYSVLASGIPLYIGHESRGVVVIWNDITNRERLQAEIRQKSAEIETERARMEAAQLEHRTRMEMQHQLIQQREQERIQIARDLHDGPLQDLIALSFGLAEAMDIVSKEERLEKMRWVLEGLQHEIRELRAYCNDLRPPVLAPFGLEKAIRSHVESLRVRYPEINFYVHLAPDGQRVPEELRMIIFRIYRELMTNIFRHAKASQVKISLTIEQDELQLSVQDNGIGFEVPTNWIEISRKGHLGLIGARERAESLGGIFEVQSSQGAGSSFLIRMPLHTAG
jgi:signal transduction histidine kinase